MNGLWRILRNIGEDDEDDVSSCCASWRALLPMTARVPLIRRRIALRISAASAHRT